MAWVLLFAAGALEVVWALALKQSAGFTRLWPSLLGLGGAAASFLLLALALRSLPVGTAYAVWVGIGALGVSLAGVVALGEPLSLARAFFLALILAGVAGLKLLEG